ncbi:MAG: hypothetical protein N2663_03085 [Chlorobi bacterium]|nr:hypothetical protein [Chlorobiota bacterium]
MPTPLEYVYRSLERLRHIQRSARYYIPAVWIPPHRCGGIRLLHCPAEYYHAIVGDILRYSPRSDRSRSLGRDDLVYAMLIRHTTAWDHDLSGTISYTLGRDHWRQTGSFLKSIALLPYLRWLGVTTLLLLPPTEHGRARVKGTLGSPYAPRNHCALEETLAEPILDLDASIQFAAFVEACHRMNIHVIVELALRVAALDCHLIPEHPEWFYWVRLDDNDDGVLVPPTFSSEQLATIHQCIKRNEFHSLPEPALSYRERFVEPPQRVWQRSDGTFVGQTNDGFLCTVPNAFADFPPDDTQPLWTDITYFRLHTHPAYNYIAYNTVRYYSEELRGWENHSLWEYLASAATTFIRHAGCDGIMLDMGHAFPIELHQQILSSVRRVTDNTILIEECFDRTTQTARTLGYDAIVGDVWHHARTPSDLRQYALQTCGTDILPCFAAADTHNTPRIAQQGLSVALFAVSVCSHLHRTVPFITSGSEFGETEPINTGLDFSPEEAAQYPSDQLPLFSGRTLRWHTPDWRILNFVRMLYAKNAP